MGWGLDKRVFGGFLMGWGESFISRSASVLGIEGLFEEVAGARSGEIGEPVISAEGGEVEVSCGLVSDEVVGRAWMVEEGLAG